MTLLDEQIQQRRANLEALRALGVDIYPRRFDRTHSISQIVAEFEPRTAEALESEKIARIERWTIHNLRHTGATHMREQRGVGKGLVRLLLGHVRGGDRGASGIYDRAELLSKRRRELTRWADFLDRLRDGVPEKVVTGRFGSTRGQHG